LNFNMLRSRLFVLVCVLLIGVRNVLALENGLGRLPQMGYNTWNDFGCNVRAQDLMDAADAVIRQGLDTAGYTYVNLDDCWAKGRDRNGVIYPDPIGFPKGMAVVTDYVHSKGLKFGIYTDRGTMTCARRPGSFGYEIVDAQTYASWGVDYLKEDSCFASNDHATAFQEYGRMRDALNATGRPIFFSLCGWADWYAPPGASLGNSWRISGDCTTWPTVLTAINVNAQLAKYAAPGGWNDPDMLIGSNTSTSFHLLPYQSRTMFSLWAVMAAPLLIGSNIKSLSPWDLATYSHKGLIAINQDALGKQGIRVGGANLVSARPNPNQTTWNVWAKPLAAQGQVALHFINAAVNAQDVTCDNACFKRAGLTAASYKIIDVWSGNQIGKALLGRGYTAKGLQDNGGSVTLLFVPGS